MSEYKSSSSTNLLESIHPTRFIAAFGISFSFYIILAGSLSTFNIITATITGLVVATFLSTLMFSSNPSASFPYTMIRFFLYIPFLIKEIVIANLRITSLILHPKLPIDPKMITYKSDLKSETALTVLANSITLTPGTLTAKINNNEFLIHTLDSDSREGVKEGSIERGVNYVFRESEKGERGGLKRA